MRRFRGWKEQPFRMPSLFQRGTKAPRSVVCRVHATADSRPRILRHTDLAPRYVSGRNCFGFGLLVKDNNRTLISSHFVQHEKSQIPDGNIKAENSSVSATFRFGTLLDDTVLILRFRASIKMQSQRQLWDIKSYRTFTAISGEFQCS